MRKIILFFILIIGSTSVFAQAKPIYFYGNRITNDKNRATSYAVYGKVSGQDVWLFKRYDLNDNLLQTGSYSDDRLTVPHGKFVFYMNIEDFNFFNKTAFKFKDKTRFVCQEGNFIEGKETGQWFTFYPDGNIFDSQEFFAGKMHGKSITYDKYGVVLKTGNYVDGEKHGDWITEKGTLLEVYDMGVLKSKTPIKKKKTINGTVTN